MLSNLKLNTVQKYIWATKASCPTQRETPTEMHSETAGSSSDPRNSTLTFRKMISITSSRKQEISQEKSCVLTATQHKL